MEKKIDILPGTKMSIECGTDGGIITIYEQEKEPVFKDGDIITVYCKQGSIIAILHNKLISDYGSEAYAVLGTLGILLIGRRFGFLPSEGDKVNFSTEEEKQILFDALKKDGKQWNAEKKCIEDLNFLPKYGEIFYFINNRIEIDHYKWTDSPIDMLLYDNWNYFKEENEAIRAIPIVNEIFKFAHFKTDEEANKALACIQNAIDDFNRNK